MEHRLSCEAGGRCFAVILVGALAFTQTTAAMPTSDTNSPSDVSAADPNAPCNHVHWSAQALQAVYLKGQLLFMQKATGSSSCLKECHAHPIRHCKIKF